jgi:signal recognition particle subunit SRP72
LEDTPLPPLHVHTSLQDVANTTISTQGADNKAIEAKQKPPRKSRVPKGVIPGVTPPPDPERWIKKSERTKVEGHGKKKKGGGATQGSTGAEQTGKKKKK